MAGLRCCARMPNAPRDRRIMPSEPIAHAVDLTGQCAATPSVPDPRRRWPPRFAHEARSCDAAGPGASSHTRR